MNYSCFISTLTKMKNEWIEKIMMNFDRKKSKQIERLGILRSISTKTNFIDNQSKHRMVMNWKQFCSHIKVHYVKQWEMWGENIFWDISVDMKQISEKLY